VRVLNKLILAKFFRRI